MRLNIMIIHFAILDYKKLCLSWGSKKLNVDNYEQLLDNFNIPFSSK